MSDTRSDPTPKPGKEASLLNAAVVVAALGYFVDIFDLLLFSIVRVPSLKSLGYADAELLKNGVFLHNAQMAGMLLGGIFWGILGDKRGRLSVLFGSILLYSVANIANAYVETLGAYAVWRLIAGIGLAGELGAGITLVSETLPKEKRGYGTMIVASIGVSGAVFAGFVGELFDWRVTYKIGGFLGLALLVLRIGVYESGMFMRVKESRVSRGDFLMLFSDRKRFAKYLRCILIGVPIWFVIGILMTFSPEFGQALGVVIPVTAAKSLMACYSGLVLGDFTSGYLSQQIRSRKKVILGFILLTALSVACFFGIQLQPSETLFYSVCGLLGFAAGYWAVFVTIAAENFGTNLRSTVTTTVPNFVRGAVVPLTLSFLFAKEQFGILSGTALIGAATLAIALASSLGLEETFGRDLDFEE